MNTMLHSKYFICKRSFFFPSSANNNDNNLVAVIRYVYFIYIYIHTNTHTHARTRAHTHTHTHTHTHKIFNILLLLINHTYTPKHWNFENREKLPVKHCSHSKYKRILDKKHQNLAYMCIIHTTHANIQLIRQNTYLFTSKSREFMIINICKYCKRYFVVQLLENC